VAKERLISFVNYYPLFQWNNFTAVIIDQSNIKVIKLVLSLCRLIKDIGLVVLIRIARKAVLTAIRQR